MIRILILALCILSAGHADARPYYAAMKGISCAACHVAPTGGGIRKVHDNSPGKITDVVAVGADIRAYFSQVEKSKVSTFALARSAFYVGAEPKPGLHVVYHTDNSQTAQMYGMWQANENAGLPYYVKAGRFFLPYGIQWDDVDNSDYIHDLPFAPGVGFSMNPSQSDTGVEFGLAPKRDYFLNFALTNGLPNGSSDNNERKAFTGRAGWIGSFSMIGGTAYQSRTTTFGTKTDQFRFGPIAWFKINRAVLMYEGGLGRDKANPGSKKKLASHAVELNAEPIKGWLAKARMDTLDPDTAVSDNEKVRYSLGVERLMENVSCEVQFRILKETPAVKNNQIFVATHLWF